MKVLKSLLDVTSEKKQTSTHKVFKFLGMKFKFKQKLKIFSNGIYNADIIPFEGIKYIGNPELGINSLGYRLAEVARGEPFEYEDMKVANKAIACHFIRNAKKVVNIGSGVGTFEYYNAPNYKNVKFVASEFGEGILDWVKQYRQLDNVEYCESNFEELIEKYGKFDLAVSVDVIEHVADYKSFLDGFSKLADRAVISTPNRDRFSDLSQIVRPPYNMHVYEFNAGELYFILKMYYKKVVLYTLPDLYDTNMCEVGLYTTCNKLFAYCEN